MRPFTIFDGPLLLLKPLEIQRRVLNHVNKLRYQRIVEKFDSDSFQEGIVQGVARVANDIREHRFDDLDKICSKELVKRIRLTLPHIKQSSLDQRLNFVDENVRRVDVHSMLFSSDTFYNNDETKHSFFVTAIAYIDPHGTGSMSMFEVGRRINDLTVCNVTYSRLISPPGRWRISDLNFFDARAVTEKAAVLV